MCNNKSCWTVNRWHLFVLFEFQLSLSTPFSSFPNSRWYLSPLLSVCALQHILIVELSVNDYFHSIYSRQYQSFSVVALFILFYHQFGICAASKAIKPSRETSAQLFYTRRDLTVGCHFFSRRRRNRILDKNSHQFTFCERERSSESHVDQI